MQNITYVVLFYILLVDSIGANLMSWGGGSKWYHRHFRLMSRYFPMTRGWTTYYFILVLFIGIILNQFGVLSF